VLLSLTSPHPPSLSLSLSLSLPFSYILYFILVHLCFTSSFIALFAFPCLFIAFIYIPLSIYCFIYISLSFIALFTFLVIYRFIYILYALVNICCDYPPPPVCFSTAILSGFGGSRKSSNEAVTTMLAHEVLTRKIHRFPRVLVRQILSSFGSVA
jgi:hypothetical protein